MGQQRCIFLNDKTNPQRLYCYTLAFQKFGKEVARKSPIIHQECRSNSSVHGDQTLDEWPRHPLKSCEPRCVGRTLCSPTPCVGAAVLGFEKKTTLETEFSKWGPFLETCLGILTKPLGCG